MAWQANIEIAPRVGHQAAINYLAKFFVRLGLGDVGPVNSTFGVAGGS